MNIQERRFVNIDEFASCHALTDDEVLQLSPGPLDFHSTQVELPGIALQWNRVGASLRSREIYRGSGLMFGFVLQSPRPLKSYGQEWDHGYAVVWPCGEELEYVARTALTSLVLRVDSALVDMLGWTLGGAAWRRVPEPRLQRLEQTCRLATRAARRQDVVVTDACTGTRSNPDATRWRDRILADLDSALEPWLTPSTAAGTTALPGTPQFRLVKDVEHFFEEHDLGESMTANALAEALGVPRRTLFRAFRQQLGLGPHAYLQLVRLHRLRDRLLMRSPEETSVSRVAMELGFTHMGRLSAAYREHFGEYPRETLKRI